MLDLSVMRLKDTAFAAEEASRAAGRQGGRSATTGTYLLYVRMVSTAQRGMQDAQ
ncbi:hypothetical protein AX13_17895 [Comamonas aquatica DA1877]|uniref:Uncharacterized protein n=1 Tax=Comamonas aquatica DA1877 TaxID=1457173 RepID=A0A014QAI6_9BURK|nr:hypothetical protein AX13_17895 [Comamonas aquatica DA1877]